jgi:hypothetical protein
VVSGASRAIGGYDDFVNLVEISSRLMRTTGMSGTPLMRETLSVIRYILEAGLMRVGDLRERVGFVAWLGNTDDALARVEREWLTLGHDPSLGNVCWFENTAAGNERARLSGLIRST